MDPLHAWSAGADPALLDAWVKARLAAAQADVDKVVAVSGAHMAGGEYLRGRLMMRRMSLLWCGETEAYLMFALGDSAALRDKGQAMVSVVSSMPTDLSLNQKVYRALVAVPLFAGRSCYEALSGADVAGVPAGWRG